MGKKCDFNDGKCSIDGCVDGHYGNYCNMTCSGNCAERCERNDGICVECKETFHGSMCDMSCQETCMDGLCEQYGQKCIVGCVAGYQGEQCDSGRCMKLS